MKKIRATALAQIFVFILTLANSYGQSDFVSKTDSLLNYLFQENRFSGSVIMTKDREIIYTKSLNVDEKSENQFAIGSVSKMYTAVLTYQLVDEGRLNLNDALSKFYPQIPGAGNITIWQMLGHQSGIHDMVNDEGFSEIMYDTMSHESIVNYIADFKSDFKPGSSTSYSNSNYILLGFIIETILNKTLAEAYQDHIFTPLNLKNTYTLEINKNPNHDIACYLFNGQKWEPLKAHTNPSITAGAGSIVSTPIEMEQFIVSLFNGSLISDASLDSMTTLTTRSSGHGVFYAPFESHVGWGHTGHIDEFFTSLVYMPEDSICISLCINGSNYDMNKILAGLLSYYFDKPYLFPEINIIKMDEAALQPFVGTYRLKLFHFIPITKIKVTSENSVLFTGTYKDFETTKAMVEPIGDNIFNNFSYNSSLHFSFKKSGAVKGFELHQGKTELYCKKLR